MKIIGNNNVRTVYGFPVGDEWGLSPFAEVKGKWRPIQRFDTKEQLQEYVTSRGCEVQWLDS